MREFESRSLKELWDISGYLLREVMFKSISEMRSNYPAEKVAKNLTRSIYANKIVIAIVLSAVLASGGVNHTLFSYSTSLAMIFFMIIFLSLNFSVSFVSAKTEWVEVLPLSKEEVSKIYAFAFLRLYDYPIFISTVVFLATVAITDSIVKLPIALLVMSSTVSLALAATVKLSKVFYERIYFTTKSKWAIILRMTYMLAWIASVYFGYFLITFSAKVMEMNVGFVEKLVPLFPFCYGYLLSNPSPMSLLFSLPYLVISIFAVRWLSGQITRIGGHVRFEEVEGRGEVRVKLRGQIAAIIVKDLKVISRNPALVGVVFLPFFYSIVYSYHPPQQRMAIIATLVMMQTLMCLVAVMIHSSEKSQYLFILPVKKMKILVSKLALTIVIYLASVSIIVASVVLSSHQLQHLLLILLSIPSAIAVVVFSLSVAFKYPLPDLYTGYHILLLIFIPSIAIAIFPVIVAYVVYFLVGREYFSIALFAVSSLEMIGSILFAKSVVGEG